MPSSFFRQGEGPAPWVNSRRARAAAHCVTTTCAMPVCPCAVSLSLLLSSSSLYSPQTWQQHTTLLRVARTTSAHRQGFTTCTFCAVLHRARVNVTRCRKYALLFFFLRSNAFAGALRIADLYRLPPARMARAVMLDSMGLFIGNSVIKGGRQAAGFRRCKTSARARRACARYRFAYHSATISMLKKMEEKKIYKTPCLIFYAFSPTSLPNSFPVFIWHCIALCLMPIYGYLAENI